MSPYVIYTIDIGDSLIRYGVHQNNQTTLSGSQPTPHATRSISGEEALWKSIREIIENLSNNYPKMDGLAVSASGIMTLKPQAGIRQRGPFRDAELYVLAPNIDGLKYVPIVSRLEELGYNVPVHVENDLNAEIFSLSNVDNVIAVNIGDGLGAAAKREGKVYRVPGTWSCFEIGHGMRSDIPEEFTRLCHCGNFGCLEAVIGGWAMKARYHVRPENASPDVYQSMRSDVIQLLPSAVSTLVKQLGITNIVLTGLGGTGYGQDPQFLSQLKEQIEASTKQAISISVTNLGETAEINGTALALIEHGLLE